MTPPDKRPLRPIGPTEPPPPPPAAPVVPDDDDREPESDDEPTHPHAPNRRRRSLIPDPDLSVVVIKDRHVDKDLGTGGIHWRGQALVVW